MADGDICRLFVYIMLFLVVKKNSNISIVRQDGIFCTKNVVESYYYYNGCECTRALFKKKEKLVFRKKNYEWFHEKTFVFEEELQKK